MPTKHVRNDGRSKNPSKSDSTSRSTHHFSDGADIQRSLQTQEYDGLMDGELFVLYFEASQRLFFLQSSPRFVTNLL
jgi:hypothetical protein